MSEYYLGEIRLMAIPFAPRGWALCDGQLLSIQQNQALFSLLGTTYGGNGTTTFALPDLRGRAAVHAAGASSVSLGAVGGAENVTLTAGHLPQHSHAAQASSADASVVSPAGAYWAETAEAAYGTDATGVMSNTAISSSGGNQPHPNMPPYLVANYVIALAGEYPSRI
jgi:microcystin-dependent protein